MTLLVRNEEDIIRENLEFHYSRGVDFVIATDNLSSDSSPDILRHYEKEGRLRLLYEREDTHSQDVWVTRMARMAKVDHQADWVINNDADEFWWPEEGSLKDVLHSARSERGVVGFKRSNFLPLSGTNDGTPFWKLLVYRETDSLNDLRQPLPPKACHEAHETVQVGLGNHAVNGVDGSEVLSSSCLIMHFPKRSYRQFERKIRLGAAAVLRNKTLTPAVAGTWKHLYTLLQEGNLEKWWVSQLLESEHQERLCREGKIIQDMRLRNYLKNLLT